MLALIQIEQQKIIRRFLYWMLIAVNLAFNTLFASLFWADNRDAASEVVWPQRIDGGIEVAVVVAGMLSVVLVGATVGQGYVWRTTQQTLARGVTRSHFAVATFIAFALPILLGFILLSVIIQLANAIIFTLYHGSPVDLAAADWGQLILEIMVVFATMLVFSAITYAIATASRSSIAAISIGLFIVILLEQLLLFAASRLGDWAIELVKYIPDQLSKNLLERVLAGEAGLGAEVLANLAPVGNATAAIVLYIIVGVSIAFVALQRQDLGG